MEIFLSFYEKQMLSLPNKYTLKIKKSKGLKLVIFNYLK